MSSRRMLQELDQGNLVSLRIYDGFARARIAFSVSNAC